MKKLILLFIAVSLFSCKKEAVYGPLKLKNGQEVELLVDHRYGADQDILLTANTKKPAEAVLAGFEDREPGYTYKVKARFHYEENPPADGSSYWYDFVSIVSKDQYKGDEPFTIQLIYHYGFGGPVIRLNKVDNDYYFTPEIQFTYADNHTGSQFAEIWANAQEMRNNHSQTIQEPKWKAIKATVKHDPQRFGKAYLVQSIKFTP